MGEGNFQGRGSTGTMVKGLKVNNGTGTGVRGSVSKTGI